MEDLFNFETALSMLKAGHKFRRLRWEEGVYIRITCPKNPKEGEMTVPFIYIDNTGVPKEGEVVRNKIVPWSASQVDLLCEDWMLVE